MQISDTMAVGSSVSFTTHCEICEILVSIDPMQKGVSLFLLYINMNKMNSLHHKKEHPKISNFLQCEVHSSKSFKVRAI